MPEIVEISVVIPTFNEVENVGILVERLEALLAGLRWEALFEHPPYGARLAGIPVSVIAHAAPGLVGAATLAAARVR
jgi:glucokinase